MSCNYLSDSVFLCHFYTGNDEHNEHGEDDKFNTEGNDIMQPSQYLQATGHREVLNNRHHSGGSRVGGSGAPMLNSSTNHSFTSDYNSGNSHMGSAAPLERNGSNGSMYSTPSKRQQFVSGKIRLLIADDAVISRKMVERSLSAICSSVTHANNGLEAVNKTILSMQEGIPFQVVLIDFYMPIMTGAEAILEMRAKGFTGL